MESPGQIRVRSDGSFKREEQTGRGIRGAVCARLGKCRSYARRSASRSSVGSQHVSSRRPTGVPADGPRDGARTRLSR
eukprot:8814939-Pyramimonas_sp.AAC.1